MRPLCGGEEHNNGMHRRCGAAGGSTTPLPLPWSSSGPRRRHSRCPHTQHTVNTVWIGAQNHAPKWWVCRGGVLPAIAEVKGGRCQGDNLFCFGCKKRWCIPLECGGCFGCWRFRQSFSSCCRQCMVIIDPRIDSLFVLLRRCVIVLSCHCLCMSLVCVFGFIAVCCVCVCVSCCTSLCVCLSLSFVCFR